MKLFRTICFFIFLIGACLSSAQVVEEAVDVENANYFPVGSVSEFEQKWYSSQLIAMEEPVLNSDQDAAYFALRVLYLPTWQRPIALRYELRAGDAMRRVVMLSGSGGYDPGTIRDEATGELTSADGAKLLSALEDSGFWDLPDKDDVVGMDGSMLIIETVRNGEHRVFIRWTPEYDTEVRGLTKLVEFYKNDFTNSGFWGVN